MIDERVLLLPISAVNALKKVRRACEVCVNVDHSLLEDVFSVMMGNCPVLVCTYNFREINRPGICEARIASIRLHICVLRKENANLQPDHANLASQIQGLEINLFRNYCVM